ncbi:MULTISPECIES: chromosome partition protein MukF [unclassified Motilimonas]|uniref:chromosome partition protein MukF n=1 Tax=Motilimonas TaxID=1914248 RepID=UPI001E37059F|nr:MULTISPECIES: chromosome partition protein MukF [unclassified Motilimonas]MCE0555543.1 chromosome partition protein MukF [Motilimonas sp. E26]MDO6526927.1 chromosome partition protein MukF [Motilimonas sp. 1_MG-2023]
MTKKYTLAAQKNLPELVGWVKQEAFCLNLSSDRLAFLIAVSVVAEQELGAELTEAQLHDAFRLVSDIFGQVDETQTERANNAVNEFCRQQLFNRFGADTMDTASLYRLTPLALGIVNFYAQQKTYSNVKLSILLTQVAAEITKVYDAAKQGGDEQYWDESVYSVLKYSVEDIFERIDLTQRAMDSQQQAAKDNIAQLLHQNWSQAISACEQLLAETSSHLRELQDTLTSAGDKLQSGLLNIQETVHGNEDYEHIEVLVFNLQARLDGIIAWGQQSIDLWTRYDRHVHKFIRTAIDMDKNRAFSQRLRESVQNFSQHNWHLVIAEEDRILELRDETLSFRDETITGEVPQEMEYQELVDIQNEVAGRVEAYLAQFKDNQQPLELAMVLRDFLADYPSVQHFDIARLVIDEACKLGLSSAEVKFTGAQAPWRPINTTGAKIQAHHIDTYDTDGQ